MKKFLVSKNLQDRIDFIKKIKGKKIVIYNEESELLQCFDIAIDMNQLMKNDYYLNHLSECDGETTLVLLDILVKNGVYVHPYGKVFSFTEQAKQTVVIDTFAFKWDEKQIVRPFLFIDPSILGSSMITFYEGKENTVENYFSLVKNHIQMNVKPLEIEVINYIPTEEEVLQYNKLKEKIILVDKLPKTKIVDTLIKYVDGLESKKKAFLDNSKNYKNAYVVTSNKPKMKFKIYETLKSEGIEKVVFFSSEKFGADNLELEKTRVALERHNKLIELLNGKGI